MHDLAELNRCRLNGAPITQRQLDREIASGRADGGRGVPIKNELGAAKSERAIALRARRRGIKQYARGHSRGYRRDRTSGRRACLQQFERTQVADGISIGVENLPLERHGGTAVDGT